MTYTDAFMHANGFVLLNAVNGLVLSHYISFSYNNGTKVRIALCSLIYRKVTYDTFYNMTKITRIPSPQPNLPHQIVFFCYFLFT